MKAAYLAALADAATFRAQAERLRGVIRLRYLKAALRREQLAARLQAQLNEASGDPTDPRGAHWSVATP